jgi:hypothetical protein
VKSLAVPLAIIAVILLISRKSEQRVGELGFSWFDPVHAIHKPKRHRRQGSQDAKSIDDVLTAELNAN